MAAEKSPAFQFYPKDLLSDLNFKAMSLQERGAYFTLIAVCWLEQSLPSDQATLARVLGVPLPAFKKLWPRLAPCFRDVDGRLVHPRLESEREKQAHNRRRAEDRGNKGASKRWSKHDSAIEQASPIHHQTVDSDSSSSPISYLPTPVTKEHARVSAGSDPFTDGEITERAARFIERYEILYPKHRTGARYLVKPHRDYVAAVELCRTWPDDRLDKLAAIFLTTDHQFAASGSRTIPQFAALASWADGQLAEWEAKRAQGVA